MTYTLRKAVTSEAKPLVGLYAESGGGKTHSALLLACGFCNGDMSKVAMIETESGRGEAWADDEIVGGYMVRPIRENFSPKEYGYALTEVERAGARALIIDSASHEWEGAGGVLSMAAENQAAGKKGPIVWQQPKLQHAREFMLRITQTPIPLVIVCMRAKYVMEEKTINGRKEWMRSTDLSPKQSEDILFEMFVHGWIDKENHFFHGTKYTRDSMKNIFIDGQRISVQTGKLLAQWAQGGKPKESSPSQPAQTSPSAGDPPASGGDTKTEVAAQVGLDDSAPSNKQGNTKAHPVTSGENPLPTTSVPSSDPSDEAIVADITKWVKRKSWDMANDLCRGIKDAALRESTAARIANAKAYVEAKS